MRRLRMSLGACSSVVVLTLLAACGGSGSSGSSPSSQGGNGSGGNAAPASLVAAAKDEGSVLWYSASQESVVDKVTKAFSKKYGIKANYVRLTTSVVAQRFSAEKKAGKPQADVVDVSDGAFIEDGLKDGTFLNASKNVPGFPAPGFNPNFVHASTGAPTVAIPLKAIGYNTDKVDPSDAPKSWQDILKPQFKGKVLFADPAASESYVQFYDMLLKKLGAGYMRKLTAQGLRLYHGTEPLVQALGAGEGSIAVPPTIDELTALIDKGAPIKFSIPSLDSGSEHVLGLSATAPHPNAARLLINFLESKEGQSYQKRAGTATGFEANTLPSDYTPVNTSNVPQQQKEIMPFFAKLGSGS